MGKINYITKQKYMDHAPKWTIEGGARGGGVTDCRYMPERGEQIEDDEDEVIDRPLLWMVILGSVTFWGVAVYFLVR